MAFLEGIHLFRSLTRGKSFQKEIKNNNIQKDTGSHAFIEANSVKTPYTEYASILKELTSTELKYVLELKKILNEIILPIESQSLSQEAIGICTCVKTLTRFHGILHGEMLITRSPVLLLLKYLPVFRDVYQMYTINLAGIYEVEKAASPYTICGNRLLIPLQHLLRYPMHLARICKLLQKHPWLEKNLYMFVQALEGFKQLCTFIDEEKGRDEGNHLLKDLCRNQGIALDIPRHIRFKGLIVVAKPKVYDFNACVFCDDGLIVWTKLLDTKEMTPISIEQCLYVSQISLSVVVVTLTLKGQLLKRHLALHTLGASVFLKWYQQRSKLDSPKSNNFF
ncbi:rho guanine nucleotide exchange factor [Schizosaccharomyces cryophilus OY26]|uniref:Rho guanine nucleotide exchange factor n=1 Tax=Schizosaccharomyces cryophilus (strain OY26 / ATCC MYA-4695 / CBS 11777 / NBRC 106824 / NRRL Y48691) TaxID=653667 RepID=S9VSR5_SCHCR|nr:rho guanine nucleotide exchange factor [Schizosaccharomyces cryophilus OY26]EPY50928.1 rho guanine nucleotide exchange factor [Schizosaccharomyces cryophilus OY26]